MTQDQKKKQKVGRRQKKIKKKGRRPGLIDVF